MGLWITTAVSAVDFTPTRGLLLVVVGLIAIPIVVYGTYILLRLTVTVTLDGEAISIHSPLHHRRVAYGQIEDVQEKWGRVLLRTGDGNVGINGRLQQHMTFVRTLRQRSPQLTITPATNRLTISSSHLIMSVSVATMLFVFGIGVIVIAVAEGVWFSGIMLMGVGLFMGGMGIVFIKNFLVKTLFTITFTTEEIEARTFFRHHPYAPEQLLEIRLETVYFTVKGNRRSRRDLVFVFANAENLRIQQRWVAQSFPDFLLLLDDMYPIAPIETKSAEVISHRQFGTGSDQPFSAYFSEESNVQVNSVRDIEEWLKGCRYVSDPEQFDKEDHWSHPVEFEVTRKGDCEDHALWAWRKLVELGISAEFVTGHHNVDGVDHAILPPVNHAWVTFWENGRLYLMETTSKLDVKRPFASTMRTHQPRFSVNETFTTFRHDLPKKE